MEFFDTVKARYSCRSYRSDPVETEILKKCVEAAARSPSACNGQPWKFIIVSDPAAVSRVKPYMGAALSMNTFARECPAFIVIVEEGPSVTTKIGSIAAKKKFTQIDAGIAAQTLCLAAADQGVQSCILGMFNEKKLRKALEIPLYKRIYLIVALGHEKNAPAKPAKRKALQDMLAYDSYKGTEKKIISAEAEEPK